MSNSTKFTKVNAADFCHQAESRTSPLTRTGRFLQQIVKVMEGEEPKNAGVFVESGRIVLRPSTEKYWQVVMEVCRATPGIQWTDLGNRGIGIEQSHH